MLPLARDWAPADTLASGLLPMCPPPPPSLSRGQRGLHQPTGLPASPGVALALNRGGYSLKNTAEDRASSQVQPPDVCLLSLHSLAAAERASGRWPLASFYFRRRKNASVSEVTPGPSGVCAVLCCTSSLLSLDLSSVEAWRPRAESCFLWVAVWSSANNKREIAARH